MREKYHPQFGAKRSTPVRLAGFNDRGFEQFAYTHIIKSLSAQADVRGRYHVDLTPRSADRGRDVMIRGFTGDRILGFRYPAPGHRTIIAECKLVGGKRLSFEHVASNVSQLEKHRDATFLLVTNATLTPRALTLIQDHCDRMGAEFRLIDAHNFERHFPGTKRTDADDPATEKPSAGGDRLDLQISYQVLQNIESEGPGYTVHVVVRSFEAGTVEVNAALHATRDWTQLGDIPAPRRLFGDDLRCFTFRIVPNRALVRQRAKLTLRINGKSEFLDVQLSNTEDMVSLPLFNNWMINAIEQYDERLRTGLAPRFLHLHGPSGTGKTRFLNEVVRRAESVGHEIVWYRLRDDDRALAQEPGPAKGTRNRRHSVTQREMIRRITSEGDAARFRLTILDDLHLASSETLDSIESLAFEPGDSPRIIGAGRSDPLFRQARYEAFARLVADNGGRPGPEQVSFTDLSYADVTAVLSALMPGLPADVSSTTRRTSMRPVDLVHYIHSLLERGFIYWADENRLAVHPHRKDSLAGEEAAAGSEVLQYRLEHLDGIRVGDFTLSDMFTILTVIDRPGLAFGVLERLRKDHGISHELLQYWFHQDEVSRLALLVHDTIKEFLTRRFYAFNTRRTFGGILNRFPEIAQALDTLQRAAVSLHQRDFRNAVPAVARIAKSLRPVKNISALSLEHVAYNDLNSLIYLLIQKTPPCRTVLCRALIARAYQNMHEREFVDGLLDSIRLLGLIDSFPDINATRVMRLAVRQLVAHGLLNSGDLRTALTLMQQVENTLPEVKNSRTVSTVEFDMCDRLQSYYVQQSAFHLARSFFLRGRAGAHRAKDQALINVSLSAEFHLHRYLNVEEALFMAVRQMRHAAEFAPARQKLHAEINEFVARWALQGTLAPDGALEWFDRTRSASERGGFGHLVPRVDYLNAVNAFHRFERGEETAESVEAMILTTRRSALRYGYAEYSWLSENLRLLHYIACGVEPSVIIDIAGGLLDQMARDGLNFIAEDYVCYQNVVVLSNALRVLYTYTDEARAWRAAEQICFSPLLTSTKEDRERRLRGVFEGTLLCTTYDPRAISLSRQGYFTILA